MPHQCTNCARTFPDGSKEMLSGCPDCGGNKFQFTPQRAASGSTTDENRPRRSDSSRANGTARGADGSWPLDDWLSDDGAGRARDLPSEFPEWPDTARRPADRSDADSRRRAGADASDDDPSNVDADAIPAADSPTRDDSWVAPADGRGSENTAQADARSEVVSPDELPSITDADEASCAPPDPRVSADSDTTADRDNAVGEPSSDDRPSLEELREELNEQFESIRIVRPGEYELNLMGLYNREEYIVSLQEDGRYVIDVPETWRSGDG